MTLNPTRKNYFLKSVNVLSRQRPAAALWIILFTWTRMAALLPKTEPSYKAWQELIRQLTLDTESRPGRLELLDATLDTLEENSERLRG